MKRTALFGGMLLALLFLAPAIGTAQDSWMLAFPEISTGQHYAYFSGQKWTAIYSARLGTMLTLPRDSLERLPGPGRLPLAQVPSNTVVLDYVTYRCHKNSLSSSNGFTSDSSRYLPQPTSEMVGCLKTPSGKSVDPSLLSENAGPAAAFNGKVWFGLTLSDAGSSGASVGGLGWFDPVANRFGRIYSPALADYHPIWVGAARDSIHMLLIKTRGSRSVDSKLVAFNAETGTLTDVSLRNFGVPGKMILSAEAWGDTLLLATDAAVAVWKPNAKLKFWASAAWAAPGTKWLFLRTFEKGDPGQGRAVQFLPLKSNTPTEVKAKIGHWLQVVSPLGIEGYVEPTEWEKHGVLWSQHDWSCGDSLCFARVRVPMKDKFIDVDFTNTQLTYLSRDANGVKVGFKAAWAREEDLAPVMMGPP